ncbi:methyltransferase, partial [Streptomyces chartreusis]
MTSTDARAAATADRDLVVRLAFGSMAAQTLRAAVRLRVVELVGESTRSGPARGAQGAPAPSGLAHVC